MSALEVHQGRKAIKLPVLILYCKGGKQQLKAKLLWSQGARR